MDTSELSEIFAQMTHTELALAIVRALLILIAGFILARFASRVVHRFFRDSASPHVAMLAQRGIYYLLLAVFIMWALYELGFSIGVLLGAAGILTVAVGFAAQTSMSNLISGLFLIGEKPFKIGDLIKVDQTVGEVLSIDLLSVKLRMFDNTYVRIPNETIIKNQTSTLTKFPIRRVDLQLGVAFKEDIARVQEVLFEVADRNPLCMEEPQPLFILQGFGDSAIKIQFSVWVRREEYLTLRNQMYVDIKAAFDREGIEIPFPHRTLYPGSVAEPFPVNIVSALTEIP
jgi:small-conductance mechanosensitive channel